MTKAAVTAGDRRDEHDRVRQCEVQRARNDHCRPSAGLFRADNWIEIDEPYVT